MKKIFLALFLIFSFQSFQASACMPFSPSELILATYAGTEERKHPDQSFSEGRKIQFIKLENVKKPFGENYNKIGKYYFLQSDNNDANFSLKNYQIGDQIIAIADYNNGDFEDYFSVYEIGKLVYQNGKYEIIEKEGSKKDWGKSLWQCGNYKPEDVMDEEELLQEIASYRDIGVSKSDIKNGDTSMYITIFLFILFDILFVSFLFFIFKKHENKNNG